MSSDLISMQFAFGPLIFFLVLFSQNTNLKKSVLFTDTEQQELCTIMIFGDLQIK